MNRFALVFMGLMLVGCGTTRPPQNIAALPSNTNTLASANTNTSSSPTDPLEAAVESEYYGDFPAGTTAKLQMNARKAAVAFVSAGRSSPKIHGAAMTAFSPRLILVGVDVTARGRRETVNCLVRCFIAEDGTLYWRAEALSPELAVSLSDFRVATMARSLQDAKEELELAEEAQAAAAEELDEMQEREFADEPYDDSVYEPR